MRRMIAVYVVSTVVVFDKELLSMKHLCLIYSFSASMEPLAVVRLMLLEVYKSNKTIMLKK
jgi:hypothetical protein